MARSVALLICTLLLVACSAAGDPASEGSSGKQGTGASTGSGGGATVGSGAGADGPTSGPASGSGGFEACVADEYKAEKLPLDMHIMLDQSGSMDSSTMGGTLWSTVTSAIKGFVADSPATDGIGIGLQYFPLKTAMDPCSACADIACCSSCGANIITCNNNVCTCSGGGESCDAADYETPEVAIQPLPGVKDLVIASLDAHAPGGGTPSRPALEGAMNHAKAWKAMPANADHKVIVVFASDGEPSGCTSNDIADVANIAASGLPDILTFVIGVGGELVALNQVAAAGGTTQALMVDTGGNVQQQFIDAMKKIQQQAAIQCEFTIPTPEGGEMLDYEKVNVKFSPGGQNPVTILYVGSEANCDPQTGGWYYDDPNAPTKIIVCDATCDAFEMDAAPKVDILLGCQTEIPK